MGAGLLLQYLLVGLVVSLSAAFVLRQQFPGAVRRLRIVLALPLVRDGRPGWAKRVGHALAPATASSGAAGSSCGGCNGCGPTA